MLTISLTHRIVVDLEKKSFMLCLDVYIQPQNLELALVAPNIGCLDVLEFGIGNEPQYQTTFTPPSPLHFQYRALPLCIGWNRRAHLPRVFSPLSPPRRRRATHPLPFQWVVLPLPASAGWLRHPSPSCGPCHHSTGPGWRTSDRRVHLLDGPRRRSGCRRTSSMRSAQRGSSPWVMPPPFFPTTGAVAPHPLFPPAGDPCAAATHLRHAAPLRCRDLPRGGPLHHRTPPPPPPFSQIPIDPELRHLETHPLVGSTSV